MIERLSGDYIRGYTKAIMDIQEIFKYTEKKLSNKTANELLNCILVNREKIRENFPGFIRWNVCNKQFEWFVNERDKT